MNNDLSPDSTSSPFSFARERAYVVRADGFIKRLSRRLRSRSNRFLLPSTTTRRSRERERRDAPPPRFPLKPKTKTDGARGEGELWRAKRGELKFMNGFERRRIKIHGGIIAGSSKTKERDELGAHSPSRATEIIPDTRVSASQTFPTPTRLFIRPPSSSPF